MKINEIIVYPRDIVVDTRDELCFVFRGHTFIITLRDEDIVALHLEPFDIYVEDTKTGEEKIKEWGHFRSTYDAARYAFNSLRWYK